MRIICAIDNNTTKKVLPVVRVGDFSFDISSNNENFDSAKYGQIKVMKKPSLATLSISSFFPAQRYSFVDTQAGVNPQDYMNFFTKCITQRKPVRVVITNDNKTIFNKLMAVESFQSDGADRQGDITYTLEFEEYIKVK